MNLFPTKIKAVAWEAEPQCTVLPGEDDDRLKLTADWCFTVAGERSVIAVRPARGFRFEGSVPRLFWRILTPTDPAAWAAFCIHDFAYLLCKRGYCTREQADEMLFLALRRNGFSYLTAWGVYCSVRAFGGAYAAKPLTQSEIAELKAAGYPA